MRYVVIVSQPDAEAPKTVYGPFHSRLDAAMWCEEELPMPELTEIVKFYPPLRKKK